MTNECLSSNFSNIASLLSPLSVVSLVLMFASLHEIQPDMRKCKCFHHEYLNLELRIYHTILLISNILIHNFSFLTLWLVENVLSIILIIYYFLLFNLKMNLFICLVQFLFRNCEIKFLPVLSLRNISSSWRSEPSYTYIVSAAEFFFLSSYFSSFF